MLTMLLGESSRTRSLLVIRSGAKEPQMRREATAARRDLTARIKWTQCRTTRACPRNPRAPQLEK